ncbi:PhnB protein [Legionella lansingensis]|uniref:PhnB protein n=2 Tax=Legionella lansingensis TaxID=45067 RepID=A0A0W0VSA0_9GAMM|nr:PhnB protein [Legionella lansingensis]SNV51157.1 PhnB protein [Legionella lansingensis]
MNPITPYLFFNGNCREAMNFYKDCFGGELELTTYADAPEGNICPGSDIESARDKIMHSMLTVGNFSIMASDNPMGTPEVGDNVSLSIQCESIPETQELFEALSKGGKITMPLADTFWDAYFGMLIDKYGFHWMLNCPLKK